MTSYEWSVKDSAGNWVIYGQTNSSNKRRFVSPISSDDIEEEFKNLKDSVSYTINGYKYTIDLINFQQTNLDTNTTREVRRQIKPVDMKCEWCFLNDGLEFTPYGQYSDVKHAAFIASRDIEEEFQKKLSRYMYFKTRSNTYEIDFKTLIQRNLKTEKKRKMIRNTKDVKEGRPSQPDANHSIPSYWTSQKSDNEKLFHLIPLCKGDTLYTWIERQIKITVKDESISEIIRIENKHLWTAYQNRKNYLEKTVKKSLKEEYLFHGTDISNLEKIYVENLDWRLHGSNVGQMFGRGTYFSSSAKYALDFSRGKWTSGKPLLLVKVLVGDYTPGDSNMTRPPMNRLTKQLYNTTVNQAQNPTIYVKYDNQEYYPEYIIYVGSSSSSCNIM